jgi:hypothetical protein
MTYTYAFITYILELDKDAFPLVQKNQVATASESLDQCSSPVVQPLTGPLG